MSRGRALLATGQADKVALDIVLDTVAARGLGFVTLGVPRSGILISTRQFDHGMGEVCLLTLTFRDLQVAHPVRLFGWDLLDVARGMARLRTRTCSPVCPMSSGRSRNLCGSSRGFREPATIVARSPVQRRPSGTVLVFSRTRLLCERSRTSTCDNLNQEQRGVRGDIRLTRARLGPTQVPHH